MLTVTSKYVRPSTSVEFFNDETFNQYRVDTYANTGKLEQHSDSVTADGLTRTIVNNWTTRVGFAEFMADATTGKYFIARKTHNTANGIAQTNEYNYVPDANDPGTK